VNGACVWREGFALGDVSVVVIQGIPGCEGDEFADCYARELMRTMGQGLSRAVFGMGCPIRFPVKSI